MEITNAHNVVIYSFKSEGEWRDLSNNGGTVRDVMLGGTWYLGDSVPACLILHCTWPSVQWLPQKLSTWYLGDSVPACLLLHCTWPSVQWLPQKISSEKLGIF